MDAVGDETSVRWLFERGVFEDGNPQRLAQVARTKGMATAERVFVPVGDRDDELRPDKPVPFADDEPVFVYGSMNLMRSLLRERRWPVLAWYDFPKLRCQSYYAHWGEFLLQQEHAFLPLAEVRRRKDWLFHTFGHHGRVFVRPDDNAKSFPGGVVEASGFERWWELANFYRPGPDCLAVVARPQVIHAEWRLVIGRRKVVAASQYRAAGAEVISPACPPEAASFAEAVANAGEFDPHPVYVMDVCRTADGYRLVEIGSVCCASLYACDPERVVEAVAGAAAALIGGRE